MKNMRTLATIYGTTIIMRKDNFTIEIVEFNKKLDSEKLIAKLPYSIENKEIMHNVYKNECDKRK